LSSWGPRWIQQVAKLEQAQMAQKAKKPIE
jgi:hypothetical protein